MQMTEAFETFSSFMDINNETFYLAIQILSQFYSETKFPIEDETIWKHMYTSYALAIKYIQVI